MTKPKRISIGSLEKMEKGGKFSSTLPASSVRIDITNKNKQGEEQPQDVNFRAYRDSNDGPSAIENNEPAQLPVAQEVNDDLLPQAFVLDDDTMEALTLPTMDSTEKKPANEKSKAHSRWQHLVFLFAFILLIALLSVGLTGGFQPQPPQPPSPPPKEHDNSSSSDDPPLSCEIEPATMTYQNITSIEAAFCSGDRCWKHTGSIIAAPVDTHFGDFLSISSMYDDKIRFAVSAIKEDGCMGDDSGVVRIYEFGEEGSIKQVGQAIEGTIKEGDARGFISGNGRVVAIGMPTSSGPFDIKNGGGWLVLEYDDITSQWIQIGDAIHGNQKQSRLGHAMSLSHDGSVIAIGAPITDDKMGQVTVYRYDNSTEHRQWTQLGQTIFAQERSPNDMFGADLDLSDDGLVLAIGQRSHDKSKQGLESRGRIAIYRFTNDSWELMGDEILGEENSDAFGRSVGLSADGNVVVGGVNGDYPMGTSSTNRSAHARAFAFNERKGKWEQLGGDIIGNVSIGENVLNKVAMNADGNRIALTTQRIRGAGGGSSQIFEYDKEMDIWRPLGGSIVQSWQTDEHGGTIVLSADGNVVIVGAPANGIDGTVRLYKLVDKYYQW